MASDRADPAAELVIVGRIASPHGVKGWVRISSFTEPSGNIMMYRPWLISGDSDWQELELEGCENRGGSLLAKIAGCETRDDAARYRGREIAVHAARLPLLEEGEFYWRQLIGLSVFEAEGRRLGTVERMMATGSNDVLVVRGDRESIDQRERLIPFLLDQVVREVDLDRGTIRVDWDPDF